MIELNVIFSLIGCWGRLSPSVHKQPFVLKGMVSDFGATHPYPFQMWVPPPPPPRGPSSHGRDLFNFSTWKCAIWALWGIPFSRSGRIVTRLPIIVHVKVEISFAQRKFRLDMYYMGKRVTIRPTREKGIFSWTRKHIYENMHPKIIFAKFQTHANVIPSILTYNILNMEDWRRYPDVETREQNERAWRGCDAMGCHSNAVYFYYLWYGAIIYINDSIPANTNIEHYARVYCERASFRQFWHFYILALLFLSIFCWYIENKPWFNFIGGGGQAPPRPHQYASDIVHV